MSTAIDRIARPFRRILVIGVGNPYRRDDGVGPHLAQAIRKHGPPCVHAIEHSGEGASLMELWRNEDAVYLFDAVSSGGVPGSITHFDALGHSLPTDFFNYSTHAFSVAEAIEMARVLGSLPSMLRVYGIEGSNFNTGQGLSAPVAGAVGMLLPRVLRELRQLDVEDQPVARRESYARA